MMSRGLEVSVVAGLLLLVSLVWCAGWGMWSVRDWNQPTAYSEVRESDVIGMLAIFKAARDGHQTPLSQKIVPELGAPGQANWSSFPTIEEIPPYLTGVLARFTSLFAALNIKLLVGHLLAALTFYFVARYFRCGVPWAFLGGLAYGLAPFIFSESPHHSVVAYVWHIPLFLVVWHWVATQPGIAPFSGRFWLAFALAFVTGLQNIYYTNIFCQLTLLGAVVLFLRSRSLPPLLSAFGIIGGAALAFALMNLDTWVFKLSHPGADLAIERPFKWLEIYGLKLTDFFIPLPTHQSEAFRNFWLHHSQQTILANEGSYLGLLGIASLLLLVAVSIARVLSKQKHSLPIEAWQVLWIFVVFTTGGLNSLAGLFGITFFRAGYRLSIVVLAIVLLFAMREASAFFASRGRVGRLLVALLVSIVVWDQMPLVENRESRAERMALVQSDQAFTQAMEEALPKGSMVFQLPIMGYPESPVPGITPYEHLRPYLYSHDLRYSFGVSRAELVSGFHSRLLDQPIDKIIEVLKEQGFAAIYINRKGFPDQGTGILEALANAGLNQKIESPAGDLVCVLIPQG